MTPRLTRHVAALCGWGAAAAWWLWPVLTNLTQTIPGAGPGDNLTFVWNIWWMRQAVQHAAYTFFRCPLIFYPAGVDLTLHTNTALPALLAALVAPAASLLATQNVLIASNIVLNGVAAYALAFYVSRHVTGALIGAIVFGWSPYFEGHLQGHFNLIGAWPLPLATLLALVALRGADRDREGGLDTRTTEGKPRARCGAGRDGLHGLLLRGVWHRCHVPPGDWTCGTH
jgi:hypothetical protein